MILSRRRPLSRIGLLPAAVLLPATLSLAAPPAGTVVRVLKNDQAKVQWEGSIAPPEAGHLGMVVDAERNLALFHVLESRGGTGTVQFLDWIWPGVVMGNQKVRLLEEKPPPIPAASASLLVWSPRSGGALLLDGSPAGRTPAFLRLSPGPHEILLQLSAGGKAGAKVEARAGTREYLHLGGKFPAAADEVGPVYFLNREVPGLEAPSRHLLWLEDSHGTRIYLPCGPVRSPVAKQKVSPRYPDNLRFLRIGGKVWLSVLVDPGGHPRQVQVIAGSSPEFSRSAVEAVKQWVYEPGTLDGKPVPVLLTSGFEFFPQYEDSSPAPPR